MKEFIISENDAGQRLDRFLAKAVPLLPASLAQKYIRIKRIKLDGKRAERDTRLQAGSVPTCSPARQQTPPTAESDILSERLSRLFLLFTWIQADYITISEKNIANTKKCEPKCNLHSSIYC